MMLRTTEDARALLVALGAGPWLVRHHELVVEAGQQLLDGLPPAWLTTVDRTRVLLGCALHDAGKVAHPDEQRAPGHRHEEAGRALEELFLGRMAEISGLSYWDVWSPVSAVFERVAEGADDRLARSRV